MSGQTILHYEIRQRIGQGGMGVVYAAQDLNLNRLVALKFLPESITSPRDLERLRKEAEVISALNHPHIETIHALDEVDGKLFLVLEYLPGGTVKRKLQDLYGRGRRLSIREVLRYAIETAEGLAHAHRRGIVHCDIKTSNLLFTEERVVKITDFGLARLGNSETRTEEGTLLGTVPYMSPEQGRGMDLDARSDIFSFGVVLFEMVTGKLPFQNPHETALHPDFLSQPAPPLRQFRNDAPAALNALIAKALEKRREDRYQSMDEMLADLRGLEQHVAEEALADTASVEKTGSGAGPSRPGSHRRVPLEKTRLSRVAVAACALLMLAALVLYGSQTLHWIHPGPSPAEQRLAVLPFHNIGGAASEATCAGLMEILTNKLAQLEQFHGSVRMFSASDVIEQGVKSPSEARRTFGATIALAVSVHKEQERLILNLNLVDTTTQLQLSASTVETAPEQLSGLQESLVWTVAQMLNVQLRPEEQRALAAGLTRVPGAYEFYLQGRGYLQDYSKLENIENAITVLESALKLDSKYALAYAGLGQAYWLKYDKTKEKKWIDAGERNCQQALSLDSELPAAHVCLGTLYNGRGQYEKSILEFQGALKAAPTNDDAYRGLALAEERLGRLDEAENTYRRAIQLRPHYWAGYNWLGLFFYQRARYREAAEQWEQAVALTPDNNQVYYNLGAAYAEMDRDKDAIAALSKSIQLRPTYVAYFNLGSVYVSMRRFEEAISAYEEALKLNKRSYRVYGYLGRSY